MKKQSTFTNLCIGTLIGTVLSISTFAQSNERYINAVASSDVKNSNKMIASGYSNSQESNLTPLELNKDVQESFAKKFPEAVNTKWVKLDNSFWVSFNNNEQKTTAVFQNNGKMNYAITNLKTNYIPANLQKLIKKDYENFEIMNAVEINENGKIGHQIILKNTNNYITLKSIGGDIDVTKVKNASTDKLN